MAEGLISVAERLDKLRGLLSQLGLDGVLLTQQANVTWLLGGRYHINVATEDACATLWVTQDRVEALVNNIEAQRLADEEELHVDQVHVYPWYMDEARQSQLDAWMAQPGGATDHQLGLDLQRLRMQLDSDRLADTREFGFLLAEILETTCRNVQQGQTENEIAGILSMGCLRQGIEPIVNLVGGEKRAIRYRHLLPTRDKITEYGIVSVGGRRNGLVLSATRMFCFGPIPKSLSARYQAVLRVEAAFLAGSSPERTVGDAFLRGMTQYQKEGYEKEWQFHHQGGIAGYQSREVRAIPESKVVFQVNHLLAWNPTILGVKAEDTAVVTDRGVEILTKTGNFPTQTVSIGDLTLDLPDILVR
ncbi:M24 family metallopeptidase [Alicyclobacillaceae bacterium I2511]|nr:M24 family metallopeptidase [Alicyclobacillaceae bacterium I2511]